MNVSNKDAQELLSAVEDVTYRTQKTIVSSYVSPLLILWGLIWIVCFLGTYFFPQYANKIWLSISGLGSLLTFLICWRLFHSASPTKTSASNKIFWRIFWFWTLLFIYIFLWLTIMKPRNGIQVNAFLCTVSMFAFVVIGLWFNSLSMVGLGLVVTAITMMGFYLIASAYYCLWMALTAGGALLGTGIYIKFRWS